jgi:hypothetical protein
MGWPSLCPALSDRVRLSTGIRALYAPWWLGHVVVGEGRDALAAICVRDLARAIGRRSDGRSIGHAGGHHGLRER